MNINKVSLLNSIKKYSLFLKSENYSDDELNKFLRLTKITSLNIDEIVEYLVHRITNPVLINSIGRYFGQFLIVIVTKLIYEKAHICIDQHRQNCITIAKLIDYNSELLKYTYDYFTHNANPFVENETSHEDKKQKTELSSCFDKTDLLNACLKLLQTDYLFFRDVWDWSCFIERDWKTGTDEEKQISNEIVAYLINLNSNQLDELNKEFSNTDIIKHHIIQKDVPIDEIECEDEMIKWEFRNDRVTVVEDVFLRIYDADNSRTVSTSDIVKVNSTKRNLKSIALGISSGKAICLSGPVGSGKTTLVEYLAKITGRLLTKAKTSEKFNKNEHLLNGNASVAKRKHREVELSNGTTNCSSKTKIDGFLKIQLGDQTDGKMLLGQYRCTDVPGEFIWQAGVLTQAVINGSWILFEDLNLASQDVCSIISNLLENNFLSVPGFRDYIKIEPGFQIFFTLRTQKEITHPISSQLLEKYLYTVNLLPLSHEELTDIVKTNYTNLAAIAGKIVDVFLKFSSGCHNDEGFHTNNLMSVPNSGRLVSTRDLLKLCKRSNPNFSLTSSECAYFVFQNSVDLFCSHLPSGDKKTELIVEIGAKLGIIESRCTSLANQYKPKVTNTNNSIKVGRVEVSKKQTDDDDLEPTEIEFEVVPMKKRKIDKSVNRGCFSFTRVSSCLLERVAVSVQQNEPVLLVGETGVGKTSSIQYLSNQTNHKLVVINMNNQSDVSDLLGGFKPVDLYHVLLPIRNEFEYLFKQTFNVIKNEKFLSNISICFNRGDYEVLIKLMIRIVERLFYGTGKNIILSIKEKWTVLRTKLMKLNTQIEKKSINISFAFIPGSLVNCIKNGDWILLDEINLASAETLECLTTILEPDGSVILLEKGDLVPIKRHPDFRIFACMNPSTDIGKKDLPISIRNRFTEFFVDELIDENDLTILVEDYLLNTGIPKSKVYSIVKLYKKLRELAYLKLNDGLGNRPVYSLRTLCRALCVCAKNLCGSIERNIYESVCLSFLTQLEPESHKIVINLIQASLLSNVKAVLSQQLPQPIGEYLNFEGYWIQKGNREVAECAEYILTDSVKSNLKDLARIISIGKLPILLQGPTSAGKTSLIDYIAKKSGNYCLRINNHEHTDLQEYIGTYITNTEGKLFFQEGVLVQAMRNGYWIILDELNLAPSDILEALNRVLDDNRELFITETQTLVKAHSNFMLFATQNPPGIYGGRKTLSRAFKNRFIELHFSEIPKGELEIILEKRCLIPKSYAQKMVKTMSELQIHRKNTSGKNIFTLRDLFRWGNRYSFADKKLLENSAYDWNQHLIDEGYLVLSSKIRNTIESAVISEALFHHFRKHIDIDQLFTLNDKTSMVTKIILEKFMNYKSKNYNVVWTIEMRRIAVLVGKAMQFDEPVLLIGPTGCGKTTVCQIAAEILGKQLRILNCHMHTEGADFLGGLRPYRGESSEKFFEWHDGPLVMSMKEGSLFLADEISLAEDSVLERLNCILEPERTVLLSEKGGIEDSTKDEIIIKASSGFQFLATMNPGGDFGKKELSPALRNRFTEIWCRPTESCDELVTIVDNLLKFTDQHLMHVSKIIIDTVFYLKGIIEKFNYSIRDILSFANFIKANIEKSNGVTLEEYLLYGLDTVFLDSLEMLPYESSSEIDAIKRKSRKFVENKIKELNGKEIHFDKVVSLRQGDIEINKNKFGIYPFYLELDETTISDQIDFVFSAPTTKTNLFRLLSALSLNKSILLEGPPGVGKTTLIENIAKSIGYQIVRINLCEHTDLADLFGTDLPDDDNILENENLKSNVGTFVWRDGPLLSALKSKNTWILLDELNLAPQSVLEGLNAILDHRGEVYIPELNKTFKLGSKSRIFAAQNPLKQGGGRKGLPQSFLNRFTKVYLKKLEKNDLLYVIQWKFGDNFNLLQDIIQTTDIPEKMVDFSEQLENGIRTYKFGLKGGPYETNLRDILRWCSFLFNDATGLILHSNLSYEDFVLVVFEKMKIVYYERMRSEDDKKFICTTFEEIFKVDATQLNKISNDISLYWTNDKIYMNDIVLNKNENLILLQYSKEAPVVLESQVNVLKTIFEAHIMEQPIILSGSTDCGKTKSIDLFCSILNRNCVVDSIDDSVTGSFQQIDYNRHLEEIAITVEKSLLLIIHNQLSNDKETIKLFKLWENYRNISKTSKLLENDEVAVFRNRIFILEMITREIEQYGVKLPKIKKQLATLLKILEKTNSLNTGGRFEWVDSKVVKSIKNGEILCLEHVNLCSSAILDRLNSVLEPNGKLLISEKGVTANQENELIGKHTNFRIFLTLDPRNGEISRAMRNRCVEINFNKETYTVNDLRKLIYNVGIHELFLINTIIAIHSNLKLNIDFNNFGLSHVLKFSFLVLQHLKLGDSTENSLRISSHEAYVVSSNVDLMGFGLKFYRQKLIEIIEQSLSNFRVFNNNCNFDNVLIKSNQMTPIKLIKMQYEPYLTLLNGNNESLLNLSTNYEGTVQKLNNFKFNIDYLLYLLFNMCSADVELREIYLDRVITDDHIKNLNAKLYGNIKDSGIHLTDIPWNSTIFPRLREYITNGTADVQNQLKLSLTLLLRVCLNKVETDENMIMSHITILKYSQAVKEKIITDSINNVFINNTYEFLFGFENYLLKLIKDDFEIADQKTLIDMSCSFLWFNRLLALTQNKLVVNKKLNESVVSSLLQHFKWMKKHVLGNIQTNKIIEILGTFITDRMHPLHKIRKMFLKTYTNFLPFYGREQILVFEKMIQWHKTVPQNAKYLLLKLFAENVDEFIWLRDTAVPEITDTELIPADTLTKIKSFVRNQRNIPKKVEHSIGDFEANLKELENLLADQKNCVVNTLDIVQEYFGIKGLNILRTGINKNYKINPIYYNNMKTMSLFILNLINKTSTVEYELCENLWSSLIIHFYNVFNNKTGSIKELSRVLPFEYYKNFSTFNKNLIKMIKFYEMDSNLAKFNELFDDDVQIAAAEQQSARPINGRPILTEIIFNMILNSGGTFKSGGLIEMDTIKYDLKVLKDLLWSNILTAQKDFSHERSNLCLSLNATIKLLNELADIVENWENNSSSDETYISYKENFIHLYTFLQSTAKNIMIYLSKPTSAYNSKRRDTELKYSSILYTITGALELNLLAYTPDLDPVERNNLKMAYILEDEQHINNLMLSYDIQRVIMNYNGLGAEVYDNLKSKLDELNTRKVKFSKKVALRHDDYKYSDLVREITHFLLTCCHPKSIYSLITRVTLSFKWDIENDTENSAESIDAHVKSIDEQIKMIEVMLKNIVRFEKMIEKFALYYRDFIDPIEYSLTVLKYGLNGLINCLITSRNTMHRNSVTKQYFNINEDEKLIGILQSIIEYPKTNRNDIFSVDQNSSISIYKIIENLDKSKFLFMNLLKTKLYDLSNQIVVAQNIDEPQFDDLDQVYSSFNKIWQQQEEQRKKRQQQEDSLYVTKTKCEAENEELTKLNEIKEIFPNYAEEDFSEFVIGQTLEQVKPVAVSAKKVVVDEVIDEKNFEFICENFINLHMKYGSTYYYNNKSTSSNNLDFISPFEIRTVVFQKLFHEYQTILSTQIDDDFYPGFILLVGLAQQNYKELELYERPDIEYNFYKDPNIPEVSQCLNVLKEIDARVTRELVDWPDHAVLLDLKKIIDKIYSIPSNSSIVRFNTGFQILRQKIDEWNKYAHKNNNLKDLEITVAEFVKRWTKLELQFWRECLSQTYSMVRNKSHKYWFFIYNMVHEYLVKNSDRETKININFLDARNIEKIFDENEGLDEGASTAKTEHEELKSSDIVGILKAFIENSNYADFYLRMKLVKSFEIYLNLLLKSKHNYSRKRIATLIAIFHNISLFFEQFRAEIDEGLKRIRTPIEKKLKEFVKIESYSKDLSYFSMKNNILHVHKNLHKFLKEFENQLRVKVSSAFTYKSNLGGELTSDREEKGKSFRYEAKIKYYMIDVKNFMASTKLKEKYAIYKIENTQLKYFPKLENLFSTSRNIVKQIVLHASYPTLVYNFDTLLTEQIETCEYLKNLEVDRTQERTKQVSHAKSILNQKKKALSDLFKILTTLGVNYKTGLLELNLNKEITNLKIAPFCATEMLFHLSLNHKKNEQNLIYLNENINSYYFKCIFKIKLLFNSLQQPNPEIGMDNNSRIKGFSVDMFMLMQNQKTLLSESIKNLHELRLVIKDLTDLDDVVKGARGNASDNINFIELEAKRNQLKTIMSEIKLVTEQYLLLLKTVPDTGDTTNASLPYSVINGFSFNRKCDEFIRINQSSTKILEIANGQLNILNKLKKIKFLNQNTLHNVEINLQNIKVLLIEILASASFGDENSNTITLLKSISYLVGVIDQFENADSCIIIESQENHFDVYENEFDNIIHSMLLPIQTIYKKYSKSTEDNIEKGEDTSTSLSSLNDSKEKFDNILDQHLKIKIDKNIEMDLKILNYDHVVKKMNNLLKLVMDTDNVDAAQKICFIRKLISLVPLIEQYNLLGEYYLIQQLAAHSVSTKMLSILLSVFIELVTKGFCIPQDLMKDEDGDKSKNEGKGEGFGLEDGTGENDVSDRIENEDQLDDAKKPEEYNKEKENEENDCKEEKGIEMSDDFDSKLQDLEKDDKKDDSDSESDKSDDEDLDKEMDKTNDGAEKLDEQIWGDDENEEEENDEMNEEEEDGKGSNEKDDKHNDLGSQKEKEDKNNTNDEEEGLDATNSENAPKERKEKEKDIDKINEAEETGEEQPNPHHNELEEPPQAEDFDLDDNLDMNDQEDDGKDGNENETNPFDIDTMKDQMEPEADEEGEEEDDKPAEDSDKQIKENDEKEEDPEFGTEEKPDENKKEDEPKEDDDKETDTQTPGQTEEIEDEEKETNEPEEDEEKKKKMENDYHESKDKTSNEDNIQAKPDTDNANSTKDQTKIEDSADNEQTDAMDEQDTGEDKDGVGQAENEVSESGHQGVTEQNKSTQNKKPEDKMERKQNQRKQGSSEEDRTLSEKNSDKNKRLKTIDKLNKEEKNEDADENEEKSGENEADEYQHVKEPKQSDKSTLDSATEEQSSKIQHKEDEEESLENKNDEENDELMEVDDEEPENKIDEIIDSEKLEANDRKNKKQKQKNEKLKEQFDAGDETEEMVEGESALTYNMQRPTDTTAHTKIEIASDHTQMEASTLDDINMKKMVELEKHSSTLKTTGYSEESSNFDLWQEITNKMQSNARELCEQLRLILEPTKCTRLKGDYRTGRRINMRKIIPYIASQFRKDKIWLRRTKPAQRDYKISIAIDDSKSMDHNQSKYLTLESISLVSQALTLLESGKLNVISFGEKPQIILNYHDQFNGLKLVNTLNFDQNQSRIAELLNFVRVSNLDDGGGSAGNGLFENLLLIISDGRNIFSEGEEKVRNAVKLARLQHIFIVYIIIDNPENKHSILDIRMPKFSGDKKTITMSSYLDSFPFPYYVIVRDLNQLPIVLSDAMRQWFELVNSEQ